MIRSLFGSPALWLGALIIFCTPAAADDSAGDEITLRTAIALSIERNPELKGSIFSLNAAEARIRQAGLKPAPELRLDLENFAGTGRLSGANALEATLTLSQVIELGDKRAFRINAAKAGRSLVTTEQQTLELDIVAEVARRFIHVVSDQAQLELTRRATTLASNTVKAVELRVKAAKSPEVELARARIALVRAGIDEEHAEHELATTRRKLAAMWGETEARYGRASADLFALPAIAGFPELAGKLKRNPDITRFLSEARLHEAEARVAESRRNMDVQFGGGIRRLESGDDHALVASITVPLFAGRRAEPALAEATARQQLSESAYQAEFIRNHARLFEVYQEMRHAMTETMALRDDVVPQMEDVLRQTEYAYQRGRYSYLEWVNAQVELLEVNRRLIESAGKVHLLLSEIERLTGETAVQTQQTDREHP
jgi:outer membrane protein, heavy metal efflux system